MNTRGKVSPDTFSLSFRFLAIVLLTLFLIGVVFLTGCAQEDKEEAATSSSEYVQTKIDLPDGVGMPEALEKATNNKLWMVSRAFEGEHPFPLRFAVGTRR